MLFAGGDDLFVVGPWSLLPDLAQAIRDDFARYTGGHPGIHLSAGIAVVGEKAPLYVAADESHDVLQAAKKLDRDDTPQAKNAITFLGQTRHWAQFQHVAKLKDDIVTLAEGDGLGNAVITRLLVIAAARYERDRHHGPYAVKGKVPHGNADVVYYGPWMWRQAYALTRLQNADPQAKTDLERLSEELLSGRIAELGLAAVRRSGWHTKRSPNIGDTDQ